MQYKRFKDIPPLIPCSGGYEIDVPWDLLEHQLDRYEQDYGLDLDPDFQRGHVWTREQQVAFVEFSLRGGRSARMLQWNCPDWRESTGLHPLTLVDGKQRLNAALLFLTDKIPAFGALYSAYQDKLGMSDPSFRFHINSLKTRKEVLRWYLQMNAGGTVHTEKELDKVKTMLRKERRRND